jgi:1,2-phenylacetyl-CoA epoxidase PaaB subunit
MPSSQWEDLESLSRDISEAQRRLQATEAVHAEVAALEQAIQVFMRKYGGAEVVVLEPNQSRA